MSIHHYYFRLCIFKFLDLALLSVFLCVVFVVVMVTFLLTGSMAALSVTLMFVMLGTFNLISLLLGVSYPLGFCVLQRKDYRSWTFNGLSDS